MDDPALLVGRRLKAIRQQRGLSLRDLADASGVSVNTISLIERGKCSPTIATLAKLATPLGTLLADFVEEDSGKPVIYLRQGDRQRAHSHKALIESLGTGLEGQTLHALLITLEPGAESGPDAIVHLGHELVLCLAGQIMVEVAGNKYVLEPEDSLLFEAKLPHRWRNPLDVPSKHLLIVVSADRESAAPSGHY